MMKPFIDVLSQLLVELKKLNQSFLNDQQHFITNKLAELEQENIEKLTIKNTMDGLISTINKEPEYIKLIQSDFINTSSCSQDPLFQDCATLWASISDELKSNMDLIQVNQTIIDENQKYYQNIFESLTAVNSNKSDVVYNSQAQIDTLK